MKWEVILAAMLHLQAPGKSTYSTVPASDDEPPAVLAEVNGHTAFRQLVPGEEEPTQCLQEDNVGCSRPRATKMAYNWLEPVYEVRRPETYDEGVERYAVIAQALERVLTRTEWSFAPKRSWKFLVTIAFMESGFRRDIHEGWGTMAIGDCDWKVVNGEQHPVPGTCKSHGLFQTMFFEPDRKWWGYSRQDVIGLDHASTARAVFVAAKTLERCDAYCRLEGPKPYEACVFARYGAVTSVADKRIQARVRAYNRLSAAPTALDAYVTKLLAERVAVR